VALKLISALLFQQQACGCTILLDDSVTAAFKSNTDIVERHRKRRKREERERKEREETTDKVTATLGALSFIFSPHATISPFYNETQVYKSRVYFITGRKRARERASDKEYPSFKDSAIFSAFTDYKKTDFCEFSLHVKFLPFLFLSYPLSLISTAVNLSTCTLLSAK
jgi:hypothetical protein